MPEGRPVLVAVPPAPSCVWASAAFVPATPVSSRPHLFSTPPSARSGRNASRRVPSDAPALRACRPAALRMSAVADEAVAQADQDPVDGSQYVPLHVHSDFSLLDGASHLPDLVARAAELGVPALALTDHGVLYGAVSLLKHCAASPVPVKPIIGNEMYVANVDLPYVPENDPANNVPAGELLDAAGKPVKKRKRRSGPRKYHLIVLAKNTKGYQNLVKLTTHAHLEGKVGTGIFARPCTNKAMLYEHREGLIVASACLGGEVAQAILNDRPDVARQVAMWYRDVFGDDYYLEIQDHGSEEDKKVNKEVVKMGKELGISVIVTNDSHFTSCLDAEAHDALICIQTGKLLTDENRLHYAGNEFFKSADEMRMCFVDHLDPSDVETALRCTLQVAQKVESYDLFGETRIPDFPIPRITDTVGEPAYADDSHGSYLSYVSWLGLAERLEARLASGLLEGPSLGDDDANLASVTETYSVRLEFELDMIEKMGFSSYFLVVWDYIRYAREEGIPVGPGRGSAAGSLVAFALRITDVDPIQYNLLFERFLNPERRSMPDIDTDFSVDGREKIIRYVTTKYGADRVAQIITFNRLTSKAVLKDVARVHSVPYSEADKLAKLIPVSRGKPATLSEMMGDASPSKEFKSILKKRPQYTPWLEKARRIEGTNKTFGIHAAGVVISARPLSEAVPLSRAKHGETITQFPMEDVEALGLLKMDFLGLKNLTVIETAVGFIGELRRKEHAILGASSGRAVDARDGSESDAHVGFDLDFSVDSLPLDDQATYDFLSSGELDGIFQLDASAGMRNIVRELRPSCLEDISSILALYRPGPLDAGLIPKFIDRKHGKEAIVFDHVLLEPILQETYGIMVYQEQIMRIARDLAGYSLGQADILRRAMGKKKKADMAREQPRFVEGALKRGVEAKVAEKLFEMMTLFAEYCFNKSHSTAYAYLTYQTAYLKANFPVEYSAALLRANSNQSDKLVRYLADANVSGVRILPPSINRSELEFSVDVLQPPGDVSSAESTKLSRVVLFGLGAVKTVGEAVGKALIDERAANGPFKSIVDVIERLDSRVLNKRSMGALVMCGAFDDLHSNRKVLHEVLEVLLSLHRKVRDRRKRRAKKQMTPDDAQKAIAKDAADWESVQMDLREKSFNCPDFTILEKLAAEKSTLGFYASGHPLRELNRDVTATFSAMSVSSILGEATSVPNSEDVSASGSALDSAGHPGLKDKSEVMCLSLVTEMNRMTTAKGRKMGKWFMEDSRARVSAIVFPSAYALCEARVEADSLATKSNSAETTSEPSTEDRPLVVSDDARVIVFGKVDRESSGSCQVIVDDVQRVEDVTVLLATISEESVTARDTEGEHWGANAEGEHWGTGKLAHVVYVARNLADPNSVYTSGQSDTYSFTNAEGVQVQGRRRAKRVTMDKMARIPLVVKFVSAEGDVESYRYGGHSCRFQTVSESDIAFLTERTSCQFDVVHIRDFLSHGDDVAPLSQVVEGDSAELIAGLARPDDVPVRQTSLPLVSGDERDEEEATSRVRQEDNESLKQVPSLGVVEQVDVLGESADPGTGEVIDPLVADSLAGDAVHNRPVDEELPSEHESSGSANDPDVGESAVVPEQKDRFRELAIAASKADAPPTEKRNEHITKNSFMSEFMSLSNLHQDKRPKVAPEVNPSDSAPESSVLLEKLRARRSAARRSLTLLKSNATTQTAVETTTASSVSNVVESALSSPTPIPNTGVDTSVSLSSIDGVDEDVVSSQGTRDTAVRSGLHQESKEPCLMTSLQEDMLGADAGADSKYVAGMQLATDGSSKDGAGFIQDEDTVGTPKPSASVQGNIKIATPMDAKTALSRSCEDIGTPRRRKSACYTFEVNDVSLGDKAPLVDLLDSICYVAGDVCYRYAGLGFNLNEVSPVYWDFLNDDMYFDLASKFEIVGNLAFVEENICRVHVRVRESSPVGDRKQARVLARCVVSYELLSDEANPVAYEPSTTQGQGMARAARRIIDKKRRYIAYYWSKHTSHVFEGTAPETLTMRTDGVAGHSLQDGGCLLLWMGRAALAVVRDMNEKSESTLVPAILHQAKVVPGVDFRKLSDVCLVSEVSLCDEHLVRIAVHLHPQEDIDGREVWGEAIATALFQCKDT